MQKSRVRAFWISLVMVGVTGVGCTRGKSREQTAPPATSAPGPRQGPAVDADWREGKLPASVNEGTPVAGGDLRVAITVEPPSLNTTIDADQVATWITEHRVYEALIKLDPFDDPNYRHVPELAERWEISEDRKTYTFHLRKGVQWHDGQPFSARDVIASMDKIQDPTTKAVHRRAYTQELASYSAPDDFTVVFVWKRPYAFTLDTIGDIIVQPAHLIAKLSGRQYNDAATNPLNRHPLGTGPFKFVSWESNSKIVLERNDGYWGKKPHLDRVIFRIVGDPTVRLQLAERGEVDLTGTVTADQWVHMDNASLLRDWNRSRFFPALYGWIGWNEARPLFSDKRVRRALSLLVDRPGIIDKLLYGLPLPTACHFYWASSQCDPAIKPLPYDPEQAARLLDEAGWKDTNGDGVRDKGGQPFRFVFMLPTGAAEAGRWVAKIKEDMARVGVVLEIQRVEWSAFMKRMTEHNFDASTMLWVGGPRGDPTQIWHSSSMKGGSNYIGYKNSEVDRLIEQARVEFDSQARDTLYRKLGEILHEEQPYTFMYVRPELDLLHRRVKGARPNLFWWQFEGMWIDPALRHE